MYQQRIDRADVNGTFIFTINHNICVLHSGHSGHTVQMLALLNFQSGFTEQFRKFCFFLFILKFWRTSGQKFIGFG